MTNKLALISDEDCDENKGRSVKVLGTVLE